MGVIDQLVEYQWHNILSPKEIGIVYLKRIRNSMLRQTFIPLFDECEGQSKEKIAINSTDIAVGLSNIQF